MSELSTYLLEVGTAVVSAVVTVAVPAFTALGVNYFRKRWGLTISAERQAQLEHLALQSVLTASQRFERGQHDEKRKKAVDQLIDEARVLGKELGEETARDLVEAAINDLKRKRGALPQQATAAA